MKFPHKYSIKVIDNFFFLLLTKTDKCFEIYKKKKTERFSLLLLFIIIIIIIIIIIMQISFINSTIFTISVTKETNLSRFTNEGIPMTLFKNFKIHEQMKIL